MIVDDAQYAWWKSCRGETHGLTSLNERRREMAILHSVGARPSHVFALIMGEAGAGASMLLDMLFGLSLLYRLTLAGPPIIESQFGIFIAVGGLSPWEWILLGALLAAGFLVGGIPSYQGCRFSPADDLSVRV